jgi:hypothetical protein
MSKKIGPLTIDGDTADRITVLTLKEQRKYLKKELADHKKGGYMHPEDVGINTQLIHHMDVLIKYFGE